MDLGKPGEPRQFSHTGHTTGYQSMLTMFPDTCQGAVVMSNADEGGWLVQETMRSIAQAYSWPGQKLRAIQFAIPMTEEVSNRFIGKYRLRDFPSERFTVSRKPDGGLYWARDGHIVRDLLAATDTQLFSPDSKMSLSVVSGTMKPTTLELNFGGGSNVAERIEEDATTKTLTKLSEQATPGILGAAVLDSQTGKISSVNGNTPLPLQSVFKLPLGIYVMHLAETGVISLEERITLSPSDLSKFYSPIAETFARRQSYTIRELVAAVVSESDNTAADWLLERVGGPQALSKFFQERGLRQFRVDRYEHELQPESVGLPVSAGQMIDVDAYRRYRASIPIEVRAAGMRRYLADERDRMSAVDAVRLLAMLDAGRLVNDEHRLELMGILFGTPSGANRLKAGAPTDALVYHKTGSSADVGALNRATNDIGIIALSDGRRFAVAAFLSGSSLPIKERERLIADVGAAAVQ